MLLHDALLAAQEAVALDAAGEPHAAITAYSSCVSLINVLMERMRMEERDPNLERERNFVAQREEIRRLQLMHGVYGELLAIFNTLR